MEDSNTRFFTPLQNEKSVAEVLEEVFLSLKEKGYDPVNQLIGYIVSEDPTYITSYQGARGKVSRFTRDELLEELIRTFIRSKNLDFPVK